MLILDARVLTRSSAFFARLLLLTIPFPVLMLNKGIVKFGDVVFNIRVGTLSIFSIVTTISFLVLCGTCVCVCERARKRL